MTLMCIERSQSPTHKGNFLQGRKSPVNSSSNNNNNTNNNNNNNNNINQQNANNQRRNSCSPPLTKNLPQPEQSNAIKSLNLETRKLERSASEPDRRAVQSNSSRYKTELCRPFEENGTCKYGDKCQFAHGMKELRSMARHPKYKTELCRTFHSTGLCPYGPRCHFIHNSEQSKKSLLTNLTGNVSQSPPMTRPKALNSLGSAGDLSPTSSNAGTPTGMKHFDDMYQQPTPLSPTANIPYNFSQNVANLVNSLAQVKVNKMSGFREYGSDNYDSANVFSEGILSNSDSVDNCNFQGSAVFNLFRSTPLSPSTPLDGNASFFTVPMFDYYPQKQQQVI